MKSKKICVFAAALVMASPVSLLSVDSAECIEVPQEVVEISEKLGEEYCICPEMIQAICWRESRFQADAKNGGCIGIMQVSLKWHQDRMKRLGVDDLYDLEGNMTVAVDFLSELLEDGDDMAEALMRYHGESDVSEKIASGEISKYAEDILRVSEQLEREHGK